MPIPNTFTSLSMYDWIKIDQLTQDNIHPLVVLSQSDLESWVWGGETSYGEVLVQLSEAN